MSRRLRAPAAALEVVVRVVVAGLRVDAAEEEVARARPFGGRHLLAHDGRQRAGDHVDQLRVRLGVAARDVEAANREAVALRVRPILMTSLAMIVGMIPMASGLGEGGDQTSPLGRAVIGGLFASTFAALLILPLVFAWVQGNASTDSVSLDPEDKESKFYVPLHHHEHSTK